MNFRQRATETVHIVARITGQDYGHVWSMFYYELQTRSGIDLNLMLLREKRTAQALKKRKSEIRKLTMLYVISEDTYLTTIANKILDTWDTQIREAHY